MTQLCPDCRQPIPTGRFEGVCPACFFAAAVEAATPFNGEVLRIPGHVVGEELARGGMGIVYAAEQLEPARTVALKILLPQWLEHTEVSERFRREVKAIACLEHPAILPVYTVGEQDGLPWFTMKLATGGSLADRLAELVGQWNSVAELVAKLAGALAHAHERGILHRDVKPANILFDASGQAYLADFGLAKGQSPEDLALTLHNQVLGTPHYLAPELASGRARTATTSSDIYSLGAVLYELLSGQPPHCDDHLPALLRRVSDEPPRPLTDFVPLPPGDLRAICDKAMSRSPEDRYATAREFATDLGRFIRGETVRAREAGAMEWVWNWCLRHPAVAGLLTVVVALVVVLTAGSMVAVMHIREAERVAIASRDRAEASLRQSQLAEAEGLRRARQPRFRQQALDRVLAAGAPGESAEMRLQRRSEAIAALALPSMHQSAHPAGPKDCSLVAVASGHTFLAWRAPGNAGWRVTRGRDGAVVSTSQTLGVPTRISRNGRWLAAQLPDKDRWQLWDLSRLEARLVSELPGTAEDLSEDGKLVAYWTRVTPDVVSAEVRETSNERVRFRVRFPNVSVKMRFSGDGSRCAIAPSSYLNDTMFPYSVRIHRSSDGSVERELSAGMANCIWAMSLSRDGELLAAAERGGAAIVWETRTGNARHVFHGTGANLWQVAFSEDGRHLATVSDDRLITVIETVGGQPVARGGRAWQSDRVPLLSWSATDPWVFGPLAQDDKDTFFLLRPGAFSTFVAPDSHGSSLGIAISPGGRWLAVGDSRHARLWDMQHSPNRQVFASGLWNAFAFAPDGRWIYGAGEPGVVRWSLAADGSVDPRGMELLPAGWHNELVLDGSGRRLAVEMGSAQRVRLLESPEALSPLPQDFTSGPLSWVSLSHDGQWLAITGEDGLSVWRIQDRTRVVSHPTPGHSVSFSPDGRWLVVGRERYEVWRTEDWTLARTLDTRAVSPQHTRAAFTSDGRWVATGHGFGKIALWSLPSWEHLAILESPNNQPVGRFVFDEQGDHLYIASTGGVVEVWDLEMLQRELQKLGLGW